MSHSVLSADGMMCMIRLSHIGECDEQNRRLSLSPPSGRMCRWGRVCNAVADAANAVYR